MRASVYAFWFTSLVQVAFSLFPAREQIYLFYGIDRKTSNHLLITIILIFLSFIVPVFFPDIMSLLGLIGGLMLGSAGYSIPLFLQLASLWRKKLGWEFIYNAFLFAFVVVIQVTSAYASVVSSS